MPAPGTGKKKKTSKQRSEEKEQQKLVRRLFLEAKSNLKK